MALEDQVPAVSQKEYDRVVKERDRLKLELETIAIAATAVVEARKVKDTRLAELEERLKHAAREDAHQQMTQ